jgi:hypothetical protein
MTYGIPLPVGLPMEGATDRDIAAALRHSNTSLVRRYAHLSPSHMRAMVEKVASHGKLIGQRQRARKATVSQFLTQPYREPGIEGLVGEKSSVQVGVSIGAPDTN